MGCFKKALRMLLKLLKHFPYCFPLKWIKIYKSNDISDDIFVKGQIKWQHDFKDEMFYFNSQR